MYRDAHARFHIGNFLALQYPLADLNNGFGGLADVLLKGQNQIVRNAGAANRAGGGNGFVFRRVNAAGKVPELSHQALAPGDRWQ